jgi:hypothetical protein
MVAGTTGTIQSAFTGSSHPSHMRYEAYAYPEVDLNGY